MVSYEDLKKAISNSGKKYDAELIEKAYLLAAERHKEQKRKSGEPYIIHPINVAIHLVDMGLDSETVAAALLHDVVEDTPTELAEIEREFSPSIALLVDGVTKLGKVPYSSKEEQQAENVRKMLLAMSKDIRVMLIKLCDRVHNMRTLDSMKEQKRRDVARETMEVYAPIANRLGMTNIKEELEDLSLKYLDPVAYEEIVKMLATDNRGEAFIKNTVEDIRHRLEQEGINVYTIESRIKSAYGIYRKIYLANRSLDEIYDIYAVRVILNNTPDCYNVLGVLHDMYKPIPSRFKDYISTPKPNGYRSLHTTVIGHDGVPFEIQIRTAEMHHAAEYGVAAHWKYKEGITGKAYLEEKLAWVRQLVENQMESSEDSMDLLRDIKSDLLPDEVFVFTPKGDVISLPSGSTVIDFAYAIHTAVGNRMIGAKVNNKIVQLNYQVKTGEILEVITGPKDKGPSRDWLGIVQTSQAKSKIRAWFKKERKEENIAEGREIFDRELRHSQLNIPESEIDNLLEELVKRSKVNTLDEFFASIGYGGILMSSVMPKVKDFAQKLQKPEITPENITQIETARPKRKSKSKDGVIVEGLENCLVKFSKCCNPLPGDDIVGFVTRGSGVAIHKKDCMNVTATQFLDENIQRMVNAEWDIETNEEFHATIELEAMDRIGLVADVAAILANLRIPIYSMKCRTLGNGLAVENLTIGVQNKEHLDNVLSKLKKIKDVVSVERLLK